MKARRDALIKLAEIIPRQQIAQLWLTDEDKRQQLIPMGFKVGQQANLFKQWRRHRLCFINDAYHPLVFAEAAQQAKVKISV